MICTSVPANSESVPPPSAVHYVQADPTGSQEEMSKMLSGVLQSPI